MANHSTSLQSAYVLVTLTYRYFQLIDQVNRGAKHEKLGLHLRCILIPVA